MTESIFDHERLDVYRLSIDYVAFSDGLDAFTEGANQLGKSTLKPIVSMLTRLIQRSNEPTGYLWIESITSTAMLSTSTSPARNPDEESNGPVGRLRF